MKNSIFINALFTLPLLWFLGYLIMIIVGCTASCFGATDAFYCGFYCKFSITLMLGTTLGFIGYKLYKNYKS